MSKISRPATLAQLMKAGAAAAAIFAIVVLSLLSVSGSRHAGSRPVSGQTKAAGTAKAVSSRQKPAISRKTLMEVTRIRPGDRVYGPKSAPLTLVEFSDYECPFCKRFQGRPEKLVDKMDGKVNLIYRFFPLSFHGEAAIREANAGACVAHLGDSKSFWTFTAKVFKSTSSNGKGTAKPLVDIAKSSGIDPERFSKCLTARKYSALVAEDKAGGERLGIHGTPITIAVLHHPFRVAGIRGAVPQKALDSVVKEMLKMAKQ